MAQNLMRYDLMVQNALRGVVRDSLRVAATTGLPGEHHFYIAFVTDFPGLVISPALKARYPKEMTIVLQHQYWGLEVADSYFEVGLSFNQVPEKLHIPFAAIKGFYDPSVQFGLEFVVETPAPADAEECGPVRLTPRAEPESPAPALSKTEKNSGEKPADVVSLDSFRKKV